MSMGEGTESELAATALAEALRSRGEPAPDLEPAADAVVTARSTLHRFVDRSTGRSYVVKRAIVASGWIDTDEALPTDEQYAALVLAHEWQATEDRHGVVEPVALLPELDAFAMAWSPGRTLTQVAKRAPVQPAVAREAFRGAGDFLRRFHAHGRTGDVETALAEPVDELLALVAGPVAEAGIHLPPRVLETVRRLAPRTVVAPQVLLHGDYVPSNLLLRPPADVVLLDPLLARTGPAVEDAARFLAVLSSDSVFLPGTVVPAVRRLRRSLEEAFRSAYGATGESDLLELRLLRQLLLRWLVRREHSRLRSVPPLLVARRAVIDRHMRDLVLESAGRLARSAQRPDDSPVRQANAAG